MTQKMVKCSRSQENQEDNSMTDAASNCLKSDQQR